MKQFVESSSTQGTLSGLSGGRGGSQTEFWFGSPRARWWSTRRKHKHKHKHAIMDRRRRLLCSTHCTVSACRWQRRSPHLHLSSTGPFPLCPCPGWGSYLRGSISTIRLRTAVQHESRRIAWITRSWAACEFLRLDEASGSTFDNDARSMTLGAISAVCQYRSSRALA
jgi:hypothetical protein